MKRRDYLAASAGIGGVILSGCQSLGFGESGNDVDAMWQYDDNFGLAGVVDGKLIGGGEKITAIDAESGTLEWTFGDTGRLSAYTVPAIEDAIYFGLGDDENGSGYGEVNAVEFDGGKRWSVDTGSVYTPPYVRDDVVYVGSDDGLVRAIDSVDGEVLWETSLFPDSRPSKVYVVGVDDEVYATAGQVVALDKSDGSVRWRFGEELNTIPRMAKKDDTVFTTGGEDFFAIRNGEEAWRAGLGGFKRLLGVVGERVFVKRDDSLHVFDTEGEEQWSLDGITTLVATERTAFVGAEGVSAYSADSGERRWEVAMDSSVQSMSARSVAYDTTRTVPRGKERVTVNTDRRLVTLDWEGTEQWGRTFSEPVYGHLYDGRLFCRTEESVYAFS